MGPADLAFGFALAIGAAITTALAILARPAVRDARSQLRSRRGIRS